MVDVVRHNKIGVVLLLVLSKFAIVKGRVLGLYSSEEEPHPHTGAPMALKQGQTCILCRVETGLKQFVGEVWE